jgi:DNA-directed RNA polymerase specialized sigma24 family protein
VDEPVNYNDIINDHVKELILRYKKSKSQANFEDILAAVDNLVLKIVHKSKKRIHHIGNVSTSDLYQTAIIALYKAIDKIPDDEDPNVIPAWISSYILADIRKSYHYLSRETVSVDQDIEFFSRMHSFAMSNQYLLFDVHEFLKRRVITSLEYRCIREHYFEGESFADIGREEEKKVHSVVVQNRVRRAFTKIRRDMLYRNSRALVLTVRKK